MKRQKEGQSGLSGANDEKLYNSDSVTQRLSNVNANFKPSVGESISELPRKESSINLPNDDI